MDEEIFTFTNILIDMIIVIHHSILILINMTPFVCLSIFKKTVMEQSETFPEITRRIFQLCISIAKNKMRNCIPIWNCQFTDLYQVIQLSQP